jgi:hypothetical protein
MPVNGTAKQSFSRKILNSIRRQGRGYVFTANDFTRLGPRSAVDLALSRLARQGIIRRIARGLYDYPVMDEDLGSLSPPVEAIASALTGAGKLRLQPSGAYAANSLGLSEQVPMRIVFLTDGPSRKIVVHGREIILRRTTPRNMAAAGRLGGQLVQALRFLGKDSIDDAMLARIRVSVPGEKREEVLKDSLDAPVWIQEILRAVLSQARSAPNKHREGLLGILDLGSSLLFR